MTTKNKKVMWIAIVAGLLLIIAGVNGVAVWETIKEFVLDNFGDNTVLQFVFVIIIFIASLGGISVIAGGILIAKDKVRTGKFLISLGSGLGIIGLLTSIYVGYFENSLTTNSFFSIGMIGLILSIIARLMAKKK